jgi:transposase
MLSSTLLRRLFSVLLTAVVFVSTAIGSFNNSAFAAPSTPNTVSNVKGESKDIKGSYQRLQEATQSSWDQFEHEKQLYSDSRSNGRMAQPKQALKNINENTKNAFQRTANSVKDSLSSN